MFSERLTWLALFLLITSGSVLACDSTEPTYPNIIRTNAPVFGFTQAPCTPETPGDKEEIQLSLLSAILPDGKKGEAYTYNFSGLVKWSNLPANEPTPAITWSTSNALPAGLFLNSTTGVISGTPVDQGNTAFEVVATSQHSGSRVYSLLIKGNLTISLKDVTLPVGFIGEPYSFDFNSAVEWTNLSEGEEKPELSWSSSSLPDGLVLSNNGILSGTPTVESNSSHEMIVEAADTSGRKFYELIINPGGFFKAKSVASKNGLSHSCAVMQDSSVMCWGNNAYYQLGDGTKVNRTAPVPVKNLTGVVDVSLGTDFSCALTDSGEVYCWGRNTYSALGESGGANGAVVKARINTPVKNIALGANHGCALTTGNEVYCWGRNSDGQAGQTISVNTQNVLPAKISVTGVRQISAANNHSCLINSAGAAQCWGYSMNGETGQTSTASRSSPTTVVNLSSGVSRISSGGLFNCAVLETGGVKCWGYNQYGELGIGTQSTKELANVYVSGISSGAENVSSGQYYSCAEMTGGSLKCWGNGGTGVFATGSTGTSSTPVTATQLSGYSAISFGGAHACGLFSGGVVKCWGRNSFGELGDGTLVNKSVPTNTQKPSAN